MQQLNEKWIKASILGTIWAASEIVLGSFLHNLRIPFSGNILTAIGIVILISASYKWRDKGIFWRAGVICALLKTMSPSAVILGPFISILSEAFLLEITTRIFGRTFIGFILGSVLAMSWNLFYKVFKMVVFYGNNIVDVYTNLMRYVEQQVGFQFNAVWAPLLLLLIIQIVFGAFAALTGIRTGLEAEKNKTNIEFSNTKNFDELLPQKLNSFSYSIGWMIINILLMIGALLLIGKLNFGVWVILIFGIVAIWTQRYKRALKQLVRPKIWVFFIVTTMLTALVFTQILSDSKSLTEALFIGIEMNLRAILLILGFSVLGTELYNPKIRDWFAKSYFDQVPIAIQLSLESLPSMIAHTPDLKTILKNPTLFVYQILAFADYRLNELNQRRNSAPKIFIITGDIGVGKTTCLKNTITQLQQKNISVSGLLSIRVVENDKTSAYTIFNITTKESTPFLSKAGNDAQEKVGRYFIDAKGVEAGQKLVENTNTDVIVFDEIGKLELSGKGWAKALRQVLATNYNCLLLSLRKEILEELINEFNLRPNKVYDISENHCQELAMEVEETLKMKTS